MFAILNQFKTANNVLLLQTKKLKKTGYDIFLHKQKLDSIYTLDKITIKSRKKTKNRLVISSGLHGIEGYLGHAAIHSFLEKILQSINDTTEVVIYPTLNPYGMDHNLRTNKNNVDLNRNFSKNNFTSINENYPTVKPFIEPKEFKNTVNFNTNYYFELTKLIKNNGVKFLHNAFLLGQSEHQKGICFMGTAFEKETQFILNEFNTLMKTKIPLTWIDLHSGYGPKNKMAVINSRHETETTKEMIEQCNYPYILGNNEDDIYDTDGDIIEKFYESKNQKYSKNDFYATCFEFGTVGTGNLKSIEGLKALIAMNHAWHYPSNKKFNSYAYKLMEKQFAPKNEKWRTKAEEDFIKATKEVLKYRKLV